MRARRPASPSTGTGRKGASRASTTLSAGVSTSGCTSPPAGATTYGYDKAGNLSSTSAGMTAAYNLQNQNAHLTPPGWSAFDLSYVDASSDRRANAGGLRMSYDQLGLESQGTNNGVPHTDWFVRDPDGTLIARRDSNSNNSNTRDPVLPPGRTRIRHRRHRLQGHRRRPLHLRTLRTRNPGRPGRRSKSLSLDQAKAVLDAAERDDSVVGDYIVVSLTTGARTEARTLVWDLVDLVGRQTPGVEAPPSIAVWRSVR